MTTTPTTKERWLGTAHVGLEEGKVTVVSYTDEVGFRVRNEEFGALVFLTAEQAAAVSRLLLRASTRVTHPDVGAALDDGDIAGAVEALRETP